MNKEYVPLSTIDDIKAEILDNMEKSSSNLLETAVIHERNNVRRECLDIIDKHLRKGSAKLQEPICPSHGVDCEDCPAYEPCDNAISRHAVLDKKVLVELEDGQSFYCISPEDVKSLPPVKPQEPKTGHWITKDGKEQGYDIGGVKTWYIQIVRNE